MSVAAAGRDGPYPERSDVPEPVVDRLIGRLAFRWHLLTGSRLRVSRKRSGARRLRGADVRERLAGLRYRLRRDGLRGDALAECFALYEAALGRELASAALAAGARLARGAVVALGDDGERRDALAVAALAHALLRGHVHVLAHTEAAAASLAGAMQAPLAALGIPLGCIQPGMDAAARRAAYACPVVCAPYREVGLDYLRDGVASGARPGELGSVLERLSAGGQPLLLRGLHCALVDEADRTMLDDAAAPLVVSSEADASGERLVYEQALEFARGLAPGVHFTAQTEGVGLTEEASQLLERLVAPLGGLWSLRQHREALVARAVEALHLLRPEEHYRVQSGRVIFPQAATAEEEGEPDEALRRLVEVKEGCRLGSRRIVQGRSSVPRFLRRYLHLAGTCAEAGGLAQDFWDLYALKTWRAGRRAPAAHPDARFFCAAPAWEAALGASLQAAPRAAVAVCPADALPAVKTKLSDVGVRVAPLSAWLDAVGEAASVSRVIVAGLPEGGHQVQRLSRNLGAPLQLLLCLEDERTAARLGWLARWTARTLCRRDGELPGPLARALARRALSNSARAHRLMRAELVARERTMHDLLAFSGRRD